VAVGTGLVLSLNTFNVNYVIQGLKFSPEQMNYDGNFVFGLILAPLFIIELVLNPGFFTVKNCLASNLALVLVNAAINCFAYAIKYG
jgi:hypothetical protein